MSKHIHIRPAPAPTQDNPDAVRHVRDPADSRTLPPEGKEVLLDVFWDRRLKDGDIEICEPPAAGDDGDEGKARARQAKNKD